MMPRIQWMGSNRWRPLLLVFLFFAWAPQGVGEELLELPEKLSDSRLKSLRKEIEKLHRDALGSSKPWTEKKLRTKLSRTSKGLSKKILAIDHEGKRARAIAELALLHAELSWVDSIESLSKDLEKLDPDLASRLGHFAESEHFLVRVVGTDPKWGQAALKLAEAAHEGYLDLFGFAKVSKVPGKKIRILIHIDESHQGGRLYFHPSPPYHGEFRLEQKDETSLTLQGRKRLVYGFCHELGHMIAMWGEYRKIEDDKHAWAHYTGCMIVDEVYERLGNEPWPTWTAFQRRASGIPRLLGQIEGKQAGRETYESILKLFHEIGETFEPSIYGRAWVWLEKKKRFRRLNRVPYLWLDDLQDALKAVVPKKQRREVDRLFGKD